MADTQNPEITIPENHIEFCRAIAAVCKTFGVDNVSMTFHPGFRDAWRNTIAMSWEQGRHGAASDKLYVRSEVQVHTTISGEQERGR